MNTITLHPGTPSESTWTITDAEHPDCDQCAGLAETAAAHATAVGSNGGTYAPEWRDRTGAIVERHSVTVKRAPVPVADDPDFIVTTSTHGPSCERCSIAAQQAASHARVHGTTYATRAVFARTDNGDGPTLRHEASVARPTA